MRSPKSVLIVSTPMSKSLLSFDLYLRKAHGQQEETLQPQSFGRTHHLQASGLVKSTIPMPACHMSHWKTSPFLRLSR